MASTAFQCLYECAVVESVCRSVCQRASEPELCFSMGTIKHLGALVDAASHYSVVNLGLRV